MAQASKDDLPVGVSEIFLQRGMDSGERGATDLPVGQSIAFSSEVDTGSREENASKQESGASF